MGNLILSGSDVTMTSLQLVDFINSYRKEKALEEGVPFPSKGHAKLEHKSFLTKVPEVLGKETSAKYFADLPDSYGRLQSAYRFHKREASLMAMSYSYELQARVFDYMTELEGKVQPAFKIPQTYAEALVVAGQQAMLAEQRLKELEVAKPKVDYFDDYVNTDNLKTVTMTGKEMGVSSQKLGKWFRTKGYAFKDKEKGIIWTQPFINKGYGVMKQFSRKDGGYSGTQAYLTPNGEVFVKANYESVK